MLQKALSHCVSAYSFVDHLLENQVSVSFACFLWFARASFCFLLWKKRGFLCVEKKNMFSKKNYKINAKNAALAKKTKFFGLIVFCQFMASFDTSFKTAPCPTDISEAAEREQFLKGIKIWNLLVWSIHAAVFCRCSVCAFDICALGVCSVLLFVGPAKNYNEHSLVDFSVWASQQHNCSYY